MPPKRQRDSAHAAGWWAREACEECKRSSSVEQLIGHLAKSHGPAGMTVQMSIACGAGLAKEDHAKDDKKEKKHKKDKKHKKEARLVSCPPNHQNFPDLFPTSFSFRNASKMI
eukprot:Hpha_TRINITY_DN2016_c0_g1::TRINITY_DN2016_c0_g1_i1::g.82885::m.82885